MPAGSPVSLVTTISVGPAGMSMPHLVRDGDLGGGDVEVAGADDLVDGRDGLGAVGQRGDGLRSADAVELGDAGEVRGGEGFARGLGGADDDALDAGDLRGRDGHQQRGGQRIAAAGDVAADGPERADDLADVHAGRVRQLHSSGFCCSAKARMLACGGRMAACSGSGVASQAARISSRVTRRGCSVASASKSSAYFAQGLVAALADVGEDVADGGVDLGGVDGAALFERLRGVRRRRSRCGLWS